MSNQKPSPGFTPSYPRPPAERLAEAAKHLAFAEQCVSPGSHFMVDGLISALVSRGCTTADAMWIIHDQITAGRYQRWSLDDAPRGGQLWSDRYFPAGLQGVKGHLDLSTKDGTTDWGWLGVTLPANGAKPVVGLPAEMLSSEQPADATIFRTYFLGELATIADVSTDTISRAVDKVLSKGKRTSGTKYTHAESIEVLKELTKSRVCNTRDGANAAIVELESRENLPATPPQLRRNSQVRRK